MRGPRVRHDEYACSSPSAVAGQNLNNGILLKCTQLHVSVHGQCYDTHVARHARDKCAARARALIRALMQQQPGRPCVSSPASQPRCLARVSRRENVISYKTHFDEHICAREYKCFFLYFSFLHVSYSLHCFRCAR